MTYSEKLRDPRWQKKRLQILKRDSFTCVCCCDSTNTLHVHHKCYVKGRNPWEYPDSNLETLCVTCHALVTEAKESLEFSIEGLSYNALNTISDTISSIRAIRTEEELISLLSDLSVAHGATCV